MPVVFRTYLGSGTFSFDFGLQISVDFKITMRTDAWIEVTTILPVNPQTLQLINENNRRGKLVEAALTGQVSSPKNGQLTARKLLLNTMNLNVNPQSQTLSLTMVSRDTIAVEYSSGQPNSAVEIRHGLTNFVFRGCQASRSAFGVSFDKFTAAIEGLSVTYQLLPGFLQSTHSLLQDTFLTAEAIVPVNPSELDRANDVVYDSLMLLSLANGNYIASIYEDLFQQGSLVKTVLKPAKTMAYYAPDRCIDTDNLVACDLQTFLETTFKDYRRLKQDLGLAIVLEYYLQAKRAALLQLKYLVAVVGVECLLSYVPSYFSKIGKWKLGSGLLDWIVDKIRRRPGRRSLRRKMVALLEHFSIPYEQSDLRFIKIRNALVHTGSFPRSVDGLETYNGLIHFLDRVVLRVLGYQGKHYLNRLNDFQREPLP
jgi:hypothetical protein